MAKEHKGTITAWYERPCDPAYGLGYTIVGINEGHPEFDGQWISTSYVVTRDGDEIETRNSKYTLGTQNIS